MTAAKIARKFVPISGVTITAGNNLDTAVQNVYGADSIMLTMRKTGDATPVTFTVYTSPDGTTVDTEPYQTFTVTGLGTKQLTRPISVGMEGILIKVTNGGSVSCVATVTYIPKYGR